MNVSYLVKNFISRSPDFYSDSALIDIDKKHTAIVNKAYDAINSFSLDNFRNWAAQNDLGSPSEFLSQKGLVRGVARPLYRKLFKRHQEALLLQALLDDIELIKSINADELLLENPVHLTPGVGDYYTVGKATVNFRWLRYIYLAKRIIDLNVLVDGGVWVDIGSYYGGLQGVVRKYNTKARIVLVDFHHQLCRSYIYLSHLYPDATHVFPDQLNALNSFESTPEGSIIYVPARAFEAVSHYSADLVSNFFSFGEMSREVFKMYVNSDMVSKSRYLFLVNRFISSPFFEATYDTDLTVLDYLNEKRDINYFDVFPLHHYMAIDRELFGRRGPRNISSPYFEFLSHPK